MDYLAMNMFLSEDNIKRHLEHFRTYKLKYSIMEKSFPEIKSKTSSEILKLSISREIKEKLIFLLWQINSHKLYFDSFKERQEKAKNTKINIEKLIFDTYSLAKDKEYGFIYIFVDKSGKIIQRYENTPGNAFIKYEPILAIDIYEHAYLFDYGYSFDKYLRASLTYLDIEKLSVNNS